MFKLPVLFVALMLPPVVSAVPTATRYQVEIRNFHFTPAQMTIPVGSQVTWTNTDEEPHIVASTGNRFPSSPALDTGDHYQATFSKPGTYTYFCSIHPQMVGTIVVK
ncbi:MAG: plastocyanin/azurin family copper-binding protein [Rhodanobacteraceae bacterium]